MASDYEKIRNENIEEYGKGTRHLSFLGRLYTDRTHFIFELLQNAEDAGATRILFRLFDNRLEVSHDGRLFNERDVRGVCGVGEGTKAEDLTQIGKFGIGFKSVYAYTFNPEIHSGNENFRIEHYIRPYPSESQKPESPFTTLFIFTFNRAEVSAETARQEIGSRLLNLNARTLLFLRKIDEIEYKLPDQTGGVYMRETKSRGVARHVTVIGQNNGEEDNQEWLIFERPVQIPDKSDDVKVEIAFQIETNPKNSTETIKKISSSPLVVYFPTEKETRFGFLIQGPYRTTPSRDNIPQNNEWNKILIAETAQLLADTLLELKKLGLLSVAALQSLPIRMSDFPPDGMFFPIVDSVRKTLVSKDLLPADDGSFISAQSAKIARGADLRTLLKPEQLSLLFQSKDALYWLTGEITEVRTPDLHEYILKELHIDELTPDSFARKITGTFLAEQSDNWLVKFYEYLSSHKDLWKPSRWSGDGEGILRSKPILRLQSGEHVNPFENDNAQAFLPSESIADIALPVVKVSIANYKEARQFLKELGIPDFDITEEVLTFIIPKYTLSSLSPIPLDEHKRDIDKILQAYKTDSWEKKQKIKSFLQQVRFVLAEPSELNDITYRKPSEVYLGNEELSIFFSENESVAFVSPEYSEEFIVLLKDLGIMDSIKVTCKSSPGATNDVDISYRGGYRRGIKGFDPDIEINGLEKALASLSSAKSKIIWNKIAILYHHCISGKVIVSSRQNFSRDASVYKEEKITSQFGRLLIDTAWLPNINGGFEKPSEIRLDDLPIGFEKDTPRAKSLSLALGMKQPEHEHALEIVTEGDGDLKMLIEHFKSATDEERKKLLKIIPHVSPSEPAPSFKDGLKNLERLQKGITRREDGEGKSPVFDFDRYQEKLDEQVEEGVDEHNSTPRRDRFTPVKETPSNAEARNFLYEEYHGHCQVTGTTFPKAIKNADGMAENYFEACSLLSYVSADYLNDAGNMICASADTLAKLKHASRVFLDDVEDVIKLFKDNGRNMKSVSVKILLAGEECAITWSQRHFMRLVALYEKA